MAIPLGYNALITRFNLAVPPLRQTFWLGARAAETRTQALDGTERIELPRGRASARQSTVEQLTFALKREHLNLTVLGALFEHRQVLTEIQEWLTSRPTSGYARQAGYLAHWLAGAAERRIQLSNVSELAVAPRAVAQYCRLHSATGRTGGSHDGSRRSGGGICHRRGA